MEKLSGECLCVAVSFECSEDAVLAGHCQCSDCQKISGTGHASNIGVPKGSMTVKGTLSYHEHKADSGNTVKRGFCPNCGCDIYIENSGLPMFEFLRAGSLHNLELYNPTMLVYAKQGVSWDTIDPALTVFEGMPDNM